MKMVKLLAVAGILSFAWTSCKTANAENAECIDLTTGDIVMIKQDPGTGEMINVKTGEPVKLYVETTSKDTIWGATQEVVNNKISRSDNGSELFVMASDKEYKLEIEHDGDYKLKGEDRKEKYNDGAYKIKDGDYKKKVERDGDIKIKDGNVKIKIDGETGERKVKVDD